MKIVKGNIIIYFVDIKSKPELGFEGKFVINTKQMNTNNGERSKYICDWDPHRMVHVQPS